MNSLVIIEVEIYNRSTKYHACVQDRYEGC